MHAAERTVAIIVEHGGSWKTAHSSHHRRLDGVEPVDAVLAHQTHTRVEVAPVGRKAEFTAATSTRWTWTRRARRTRTLTVVSVVASTARIVAAIAGRTSIQTPVDRGAKVLAKDLVAFTAVLALAVHSAHCGSVAYRVLRFRLLVSKEKFTNSKID